MKILALDTAQAFCSVAVLDDIRVVAMRSRAMERGHAEALMPMVLAAMSDARLALKEIDLFAATRGPGAFTGIRIGLAAARGMALAAGKPCWGVGTIAAVARAVDPDQRSGRTLLVALETKRDDVYAQAFDDRLVALGDARAVAVDILAEDIRRLKKPVLVAGDAKARVLEVMSGAIPADGADVVINPAIVAHIAREEWVAAGMPASPSPPRPLYLRPPAVTLKKPILRA